MTRRTVMFFGAAGLGVILALVGLTLKKGSGLSRISTASAQVVQQHDLAAEADTTLALQRLQQTNQQLEAYVQDLLNAIQQLELDANQGQAALMEARQGDQQTQQTLLTVQQQLQASQTQEAQLQERHKTATDLLKVAQQQLQQCTTSAQAAQAEATEQHQQAQKAHQQDVKSLQATLATSQEEKQTTQQELGQTRQQLQQCTIEARVALAKAAKQHDEVMAERQKEIQALQQDLQATQQDLKQVQTQLQNSRQQQAQWQERYQAVAATLDTTQQALHEQAAEIEDARARQQAVEAAQAQQTAQLGGVYSQLVDHLQEELQADTVTVHQNGDHLLLRMSGRAIFSGGEASVRYKGRMMLQKISTVLQTFPAYEVHVEGHTDSMPLNSELREQWRSNWELSTARALSVIHCLQMRGVAPLRLTAEGHGPYHPIASNETRAGRVQNRRVDIIVRPSQHS